MRIHLLVTLIVAIYVLLPGYMLLMATGQRRHIFLLSYAISISTLVLCLALFLMLQETNGLWFIFLYSVILVLTTIVVWYFQKRIPDRSITTTQSKLQNRKAVICCLILILFYSVYHSVVGPYTEIPSDFWKHLARVAIEHRLLIDGDNGPTSPLVYLSSGSSLIYVALALVAHIFAVDPLDLVPAITLVTSSIFLTSVYWFCISLFGRYFSDTRWVLIAASLASILTLVSFGTATFSYARYYAYFPTIFCFPLVYASIVIFSDFLELPQEHRRLLFLVPLFLVAMVLIHRQEALLTIIILGGVCLVRSIRSFSPSSHISRILVIRTRASLCFFLSLFAIIVFHAFTTRELADWHNTPHVIDLSQLTSLLSGVPIDNPTFRLWDTVGIFGLLVFAWSALNWKIIYQTDYLVAGLLVPFFTSLNPLYTTVFLHYEDPTILWRTAYLIPFPIIAALLTCHTLSSKSQIKKRILKGYLNILVIVSLFISLSPWSFQGYYNRTSRVPSLMPVHKFNGAALWMDLTTFVRSIESSRPVRRILTDEMTKFVLYAANRGEIWWWPQHEYFPKHNQIYKEDFTQSDLTDTLLVVNRRDATPTESAKHAGHWPVQVLNVSRHYPEDLSAFLSTHKNNFELLWEFNKISVYQMSTFDE